MCLLHDIDERDNARRDFARQLIDVLRISRDKTSFTLDHVSEIHRELYDHISSLMQRKLNMKPAHYVCIHPWYAISLSHRMRIWAFNKSVHKLVVAQLKVCIQMKTHSDVSEWVLDQMEMALHEYFWVMYSSENPPK